MIFRNFIFTALIHNVKKMLAGNDETNSRPSKMAHIVIADLGLPVDYDKLIMILNITMWSWFQNQW